MTLVEDGGFRLWVAGGYRSNYYYIDHSDCKSHTGGASCGIVAVGMIHRRTKPMCSWCQEAPPPEMMGMIDLVEWRK